MHPKRLNGRSPLESSALGDKPMKFIKYIIE
jgi:hypothetical protein